MEKIEKTQIYSFKCIKPMVFHWGCIFTVDNTYTLFKSEKRKIHIITDHDVYMSILNSLTFNRKNANRDMKIVNKMYDDYKIEVEVEYLTFIGDDNNNYSFCVQSLDDLIVTYNLDKSKKVNWNHTVDVFGDYFEDKKMIRSDKLMDLLD